MEQTGPVSRPGSGGNMMSEQRAIRYGAVADTLMPPDRDLFR